MPQDGSEPRQLKHYFRFPRFTLGNASKEQKELTLSVYTYPRLILEREEETDLCRITVELLYLDSDPETDDELLFSRYLFGIAQNPDSRLGNRGGDERVCISTMSALVSRKVHAADPTELREAVGASLLEFDAPSGEASSLAFTISDGVDDDRLSRVMSACDDSVIGMFGTIEEFAICDGINPREALCAMLPALGPLTGPFNGLFLVGGVEVDLSSNHKLLLAETLTKDWVHSETQGHESISIETWPDVERNRLVICCGFASHEPAPREREVEIDMTAIDTSSLTEAK